MCLTCDQFYVKVLCVVRVNLKVLKMCVSEVFKDVQTQSDGEVEADIVLNLTTSLFS